MTSFSKPSTPVFSLYVPAPKNIKVEFIYNFYVYDESTNPVAGVPESLKTKSIEQVNTKTTNFSLKVPRYNQINWDPPVSTIFSSAPPEYSISNNFEKVVSEDSFLSSRFFSYSFSSLENLEEAYKDINNKKTDEGISQAGIIDKYVSNLLNSYVETGDETNVSHIRQQIVRSVGSLERIADRPMYTLGTGFYDSNGKKIDASGFDQLVSEAPTLNLKINSLVLPDIFVSASLSEEDINSINSNYQTSTKENSSVDELVVKPVFIGKKVTNVESIKASSSIIGYLIERYELTPAGFLKNKVITIENSSVNSYVDVEIKYGSTYYYSVKSIARIDVPGYDKENFEIRNITYYVGSSPISKSVFCSEMVPPPPPVDINFVWNYKKRKLQVVWGMPINSQRDIKQFQIFRRSSIDEPFELLSQRCFDYSTKRYTTGEIIDGNSKEMSQENASFVSYDKSQTLSYIDDDFIADIEASKTSKYVYTIVSIDAHGMISNYGAQFEVSYDFFKNKIIKKLVSNAGAPRQYPNMYLDVDLFKDVIKTEGPESLSMKIYFMPEYFKIKYNDGTVQTMLSTKQQNSFYNMQFINLQNQKSDSLKISIDDSYGLVK